MMKKIIYLSLCTASILCAQSDIEDLKQELQLQQKNTQVLFEKIERLEAKTDNASVNTSASFSQNAYLPDMAFILNMSAVARDVSNSEYANAATPGFVNAGNMELPFNANRGFNFNYAEIALHSSVDPYFDAFVIFHIQSDSLEIEEAYVTTRALPYALRVKAGRFRSDFGRINAKHQHSWSFDEQNLVYKSMFGPDVIKDAGVQLQWVAPTDTYIMFGAEAMQGTNARTFGYPEENNLYVAYAKSSIDIGDDISVLGGVSGAYGKTIANKDSNVYGVDLTVRDQLGSYSALVWQSEYLSRDKDNENDDGLYTQLVYQYNNNYSGGVRYDYLQNVAQETSDRYTAMLEYKPFPMSRLRLEYSYDRSKEINGDKRDINTVIFSLNIAAGAHGAHSY